jgi:hypothetical protein
MSAPVQAEAVIAPRRRCHASHSNSLSYCSLKGAKAGTISPVTNAISVWSTSSIAQCGVTVTLPEHRTGSPVAVTMRTSNRGASGLPVTKDSQPTPTDESKSNSPNSVEGEVSGIARMLTEIGC